MTQVQERAQPQAVNAAVKHFTGALSHGEEVALVPCSTTG